MVMIPDQFDAPVFLKNISELTCGDGWFKPMYTFIRGVEDINKRIAPIAFVALQIKEKFGTVRVYWDLVDESGNSVNRDLFTDYVSAFTDLLNTLKEDTSKTCEWCGKEEEHLKATHGWIKYICAECYKKRYN